MKTRTPLLLLAVLLAGCTTRQVVEVDAFSDVSFATCCAYVLIPADRSVDIESPEWRTLKRQLGRALKEKGFYEAASRPQAEIAITVASGVGETRTVERSAPDRAGGFTTVAESGANPSGNDYSVNNDALSTAAGSMQETGAPGQGRVGPGHAIRIYDRWLLVRAYDLSNPSGDGRYAESWRTVVRSEGPSADLEAVIPFMIAAAAPYLGETLYETREMTLSEDSEQVRAIAE